MEELDLIRNYERYAKFFCPGDEWDIEENDNYISGYTIIDNFDFEYYLTEEIGIPENYIDWSSHKFYVNDYDEKERIKQKEEFDLRNQKRTEELSKEICEQIKHCIDFCKTTKPIDKTRDEILYEAIEEVVNGLIGGYFINED
jgi:hypothetical protein